MIRHILAALVAAPLFLAACEDVPNEIDPNCVSDCEVDTGEDTDDPAVVTVPFAARTTIDGADEPCMVRYVSRGDSGHTVTKPSGETVQLNAGETYDLFVGTPNGLHERADGVLFTSRPTVAEPMNSSAATPQTATLELDPYFKGWFTCEVTPSEPFQTLVVETEWKEWSYGGEWDVVVNVAANCLDFGGRGLHCFDGAGSVKRYGHSGDFLYESDSGSVELTPNSFNYSGFNDDFTVTCVAH